MIDLNNPPVSIQELIEEVDEDGVFPMFELFQTDTKDILENMETSLLQGDAVQLRKRAHAAKGCCEAIWASAAAAAAHKLEHVASDGKLDEAVTLLATFKREYQSVIEYIQDYTKRASN